MKQPAHILNSCLLLVAVFLIVGIIWNWRDWSNTSRVVPRTTSSYEGEISPPSSSEGTTPQIPNLTPSSSETVSPPVPTPTNANKPIPETKQLAVPFTSQAPEKNWAQPWQDACEEAALLMLDAYYKKYALSPLFARDELLKILAYEDGKKYGGSIDIEKIKEVGIQTLRLDKHGEPTIIENPTADQIKGFIAAGKPVLVVADGKELPNPNFTNGGPEYHALVITGYTKDTFITNDPGTRLGEDFVYQIPDLMSAIRDWNDGNVKQGRRVIMVVE